MNLHRLFLKYRAKMLPEAILRAFLYACSAAAITAFGLSLGYHITVKELPLKLALCVCVPVFLVCFLALLAIRFFPTSKRVADRIDETGLQERAGTMLAYRKKSGGIVEMQRDDAIKRIGNVKTGKLPKHYKLREFLLCGGCVAAAAIMLLLPNNLFALKSKAEPDEETIRQEQIVKDLIDTLREETRQAEFDREFEKEMKRIIDELEKELHESETMLERAAAISEAQRKIEEAADKAVTQDEIGEAMQNHELTRELGEAIARGDEEAVKEAMEHLQNELQEDKDKVDQLKKEIEEALKESGVRPKDPLYKALDHFSDSLSKDDEKMKEAFEEGEKEIIDALQKQQEIKEEADQMNEQLEEAKNDLLGNEETSGDTSDEATSGESGEGEEGSSGEGEEGNSGEGEEGSSGEGEEGSSGEGEEGTSGEGEEGTSGDGEGGEEGENGQPGPGGQGASDPMETMLEAFYDPISGKITYGKVFASYFANYLNDKQNGKVPADMQEILDTYFDSLME